MNKDDKEHIEILNENFNELMSKVPIRIFYFSNFVIWGFVIF